MSWENWRVARPQSHRGSYIRRIASLTPRCWRDGRFRLSIPTVSVRVSLHLRSRNRIPVEYTTLYSSVPPLAVYAPLVANAISAKTPSTTTASHPPPSSTFSCCNSYWFSEKSEMPQFAMCLFTVHTDSCVSFALLSVSRFLLSEVTISYFERLAFVKRNHSISFVHWKLPLN